MVILKVNGIYRNGRIMVLETNSSIKWSDLSLTQPPELSDDCKVELTISLDEEVFLYGNNGNVWATYDPRQAEIIQNTLLAQDISSEVRKFNLGNREMLLLSITNESDINDAVDFIWRNNIGLRLKPDWTYADGEINKSFEQWLSGQ